MKFAAFVALVGVAAASRITKKSTGESHAGKPKDTDESSTDLAQIGQDETEGSELMDAMDSFDEIYYGEDGFLDTYTRLLEKAQADTWEEVHQDDEDWDAVEEKLWQVDDALWRVKDLIWQLPEDPLPCPTDHVMAWFDKSMYSNLYDSYYDMQWEAEDKNGGWVRADAMQKHDESLIKFEDDCDLIGAALKGDEWSVEEVCRVSDPKMRLGKAVGRASEALWEVDNAYWNVTESLEALEGKADKLFDAMYDIEENAWNSGVEVRYPWEDEEHYDDDDGEYYDGDCCDGDCYDGTCCDGNFADKDSTTGDMDW